MTRKEKPTFVSGHGKIKQLHGHIKPHVSTVLGPERALLTWQSFFVRGCCLYHVAYNNVQQKMV